MPVVPKEKMGLKMIEERARAREREREKREKGTRGLELVSLFRQVLPPPVWLARRSPPEPWSHRHVRSPAAAPLSTPAILFECGKSYSPNAIGVSLALEKIFPHSSVDIRNFSMLVCSKGGGGLLQKCMEIVAELWQANLKAELVPLLDPSLTEQYEYASEA
ncbi:uncharacterized protein LOC120254373 [Dioscorea cayenensis subsp. rotundata]|uniref:Uncharacterized protein LOC120254373 n=1 Tax=Dioscorea cayennensis subsp. rotundata TaxID=55577 RepID=A0AB40AUG2_DIOCR|nr:uncharacterized protein LOC120254373 [Dioscorea cayenensis subsp. rotundata]